jgi:glutamyl-tRNA synthetase
MRLRFAPSPTGFLHVGGARTALFNWLLARKHGGTFILRIEDTDLTRSSNEMVQVILDSMKWLGLDWDEGPYPQSERFGHHLEIAHQLEAAGKAYRCYMTADEIEQQKQQAMAEKKVYQYNPDYLSPQEVQKRKAANAPYAIRFKIPAGETRFHDLIHGDHVRNHKEIEDFVIVKSDGSPTYHLACVVDDHDMQITHVIRGDDHLTNTPKQILLYQALGWEMPLFGHLPLILGKDRTKLSKRHAAVSVGEYQENGYLPEGMVNFLALLGWSPGDNKEYFSREELIELFDLKRINKANAIFDTEKLDWINGQHIKNYDNEKLLAMVKPYWIKAGYINEDSKGYSQEWLIQLINLLKERMRVLPDFVQIALPYFKADFEYDKEACEKQFVDKIWVMNIFTRLYDIFSHNEEFNHEKIETILRSLAEELNVKPANIIHPLRLALTGMTKGPSLFHLMEVMGNERIKTRLLRVINWLKEN